METLRTTSLVSMSVNRVYINRSCSLFSLCFLLRPFLHPQAPDCDHGHIPGPPAFTSLKRFSAAGEPEIEALKKVLPDRPVLVSSDANRKEYHVESAALSNALTGR